MASDEDHYKVLGVPSGEEGMKLGDKEIQSAYRAICEMVCGDALNPLQDNLLISNANASAPNSRTPAEPEPPNLSDLVGAGYQAAERQRKLSKAS